MRLVLIAPAILIVVGTVMAADPAQRPLQRGAEQKLEHLQKAGALQKPVRPLQKPLQQDGQLQKALQKPLQRDGALQKPWQKPTQKGALQERAAQKHEAQKANGKPGMTIEQKAKAAAKKAEFAPAVEEEAAFVHPSPDASLQAGASSLGFEPLP